MSTSAVRWWDRSPIPPPRQATPYIEVKRPRPGGSYYGICLNQELVTADTHWDDRLSGKLRCREMWAEDCQRCPDKHRKWYGYMPILFFATGKVACLEVSWGAATSCAQLNDKRIPLRGMRLEVGRYNSGKFGRCWAKVEAYHRPIVLPPAEPTQELLDMIFGPTELGIPAKRRGWNGGER
jgi:hypothetical protein